MTPTDTNRLDWVLATVETQNEQAAGAWEAAHTLGMKGRKAIDAAMHAVFIEPGDDPAPLTALDLVRMELGRREAGTGSAPSESRNDVLIGNACTAIEELQYALTPDIASELEHADE